MKDGKLSLHSLEKRQTQFLFKKWESGLLFHRWLLHKAAPSSALFTQSKLHPTTQGGVLIHTVSPLPPEMYPTPTGPKRWPPRGLRLPWSAPRTGWHLIKQTPLPDTQNAQATIRKPGFHTKQDPFLQKQFPISDSSHGEQPFLGCASPQTPRGPKPRGSPTQRRASYKPCSSRQPRPPPTLADLTAAKARNPWVRKRTPPHKRGVLPGDPRKTLSAPGPVPALPRPGAPRSPAHRLLLPAWQALQLLGPQRLHLVQQTMT